MNQSEYDKKLAELKARAQEKLDNWNWKERAHEEIIDSQWTVLTTIVIDHSAFSTKNEDGSWNLMNLKKQIIADHYELFAKHYNDEQMQELDSIPVSWKSKYTYRTMGTYRYTESRETGLKHSMRISANKYYKWAPEFAIRGVLCHELCHIKYHGHSRGFWSLLNQFGYQSEYKAWLRSQVVKMKMVAMKHLTFSREIYDLQIQTNQNQSHEKGLELDRILEEMGFLKDIY